MMIDLDTVGKNSSSRRENNRELGFQTTHWCMNSFFGMEGRMVYMLGGELSLGILMRSRHSQTEEEQKFCFWCYFWITINSATS